MLPLLFLLQLTRNLTVTNDDDSAMMYVIFGTHLCHATVHFMIAQCHNFHFKNSRSLRAI